MDLEFMDFPWSLMKKLLTIQSSLQLALQKMHAAQIVEIAPRSNWEVFEDPATSSKSLPRHFKVNSTRLYDKAKSTADFDVHRDSLLVAKCICLTVL